MSGTTLVETLVTLALVAIVVTVAVVRFDRVSPPLERGSQLTKSFLGQARSRAMATTRAYRVSPADDTTLIAEYASSCASGTWTEDDTISLELPAPVVFTSTAWQACFDNRGLAGSALSFTLSETLDSGVTRTRDMQLLLGGAVKVVP